MRSITAGTTRLSVSSAIDRCIRISRHERGAVVKLMLGLMICVLPHPLAFGLGAREPVESRVAGDGYSNPVWEPVLADPTVVRHEGAYFVFGTQDFGRWDDESGVRFVPILSSTDLVNWTYAGSVFTRQTRPTWGTPGAGIWAPDVVKLGDEFRLYYSLSTWGDPNPGIGVASSAHPLGPWTDHGELLRSRTIGVNNSIDPNVFEADDSVFIVWGSFRGIYIAELSRDGLALSEGPNAANTRVRIAGLDTARRWNSATYEAPYVLRRGDYYYLFVSSGTCCEGHRSTYHVSVARATSPLGPYYDSRGRTMLSRNRGHSVIRGSAEFVGPGHNSIAVDDAGNDYLVYHAYETSEDPAFGGAPRRSLMIDRLIWSDDGWPSAAGAIPSVTSPEVPVIK